MLSETALRNLTAIVGAKNCRRGELDLALYSYDSSPFIHKPEAVVFPETAEQAAAVIALAAGEGCPIVPRGAGTSLSGGAVAWKGGLTLCAAHMNRILDMDPLEETVLVECGVVNLDLQKYLEPHGFMFPPDPASQKSSTLGGNLGENAGGMRGVKYGITKHHVLGLEVILADGRLARTGRLARGPEAAGPDLTGLFLASEGTLGFITKALLKITPLPREFRTVSAVFDDLGKSGRAVSAVIAAGIIPTAMEIMDHHLIGALEDYLHLGFPREAEAMLLIEVDGLGPELDRQMSRVVELCREAGAVDLSSAQSAEERDQLWLARRSGNGAMGRIKPATMVQDVTVPVNRLPEMLSLVQDVAARHNIIIVQVAHAGDGNLHPHILYTPGDDDEYQRALAASHDIFHAALEAGGALTGEHGIGLEKVDFMASQFTADELAFMARLKKSLDPAGILNPGKVLPDDSGKAEEPCQAESAACSPVYPRSIEEATRIMCAAYLGQRPVRPAGRLNSLQPDEAALVVSARDLCRVTSLEPENLLAVVEAGATPAQVEAALKPTGLYWPVTGLGGRSLGGIMAEGLLGAETMSRGSMIDWVLGTAIISPEGRLVKSGGRTLKNVSGYDFTRLAWRSRGRLGLCASFILKLLPRPEQAPVLEIAMESPIQAAVLAARVILSPDVRPESLRLVYDRTSTTLLVWLAGFAEVVAAQTKAVAELAGDRSIATRPDGFAFWEQRAAAPPEGRRHRFMGARKTLIEMTGRLDVDTAPELLRAELDIGGGRAEFIMNSQATDRQLDILSEGLIPDRFVSSGPVYERLKKGLDPEDLLYPTNEAEVRA